jgi:hypothetical protein
MAKLIPLNQGKYAIVDDEDFEWLNQWKWTYNPHGGGYASRTDRSGGKQKTILMHRVILGAKDGEQVDHINRNRLDNRKENLRLCTPADNAKNAGKRKDGKTSKYKGVYYCKKNNKYGSAIQVNGKRISLGYYDEELDAAYYYNMKAKELHGEFAVLNDIPEDYVPKSEFSPNKARGKYSKYRGVTYQKRDGVYYARIQHKGRKIHLGSFKTDRVAAEIYNTAAVELHGDKAILNEFEVIEGIID